jgi:hypothetical protein
MSQRKKRVSGAMDLHQSTVHPLLASERENTEDCNEPDGKEIAKIRENNPVSPRVHEEGACKELAHVLQGILLNMLDSFGCFGPVEFIGLCLTSSLGVFIGHTEKAASRKKGQTMRTNVGNQSVSNLLAIRSSHGWEGLIRFTRFPERKEQYGELSCDGDDGPLLGLGRSLLGETQFVLAQRAVGSEGSRDILRGAHRQTSQVSVSAFGMRNSLSVSPL